MYEEDYFHSLYYKETPDAEPCNYCGFAHVGMFQDSYLIMAEEAKIDLRYFPHFKNIEFYGEDTKHRSLYLENIGTYKKQRAATILLWLLSVFMVIYNKN